MTTEDAYWWHVRGRFYIIYKGFGYVSNMAVMTGFCLFKRIKFLIIAYFFLELLW